MLDLSNVTLLAITSVKFDEHIASLQRSMQCAKFAKVVLATHEKPNNLPDDIVWEDIGKKINYEQFSEYCIYHMTDHVHTDFCLHVHDDSWILRPDLWIEEFFDYDYIGAPWPLSYEAFVDPFGRHIRVGNGGFSLRSKRLMNVPKHIHIPFEVNEGNFYKHMNANSYNEDGNICVHNRHLYELMGCKFAPVEVAARFSTENNVPETVQSFGFHKRLPIWAQ